MISVDYSLFIQIANFLLLLFLLNIILYRPIRKILGKRSDEMNSFQSMIDDFLSKSTRCEKDLEENKGAARKEGFEEKENFKKEGLEEEKGVLQEAVTKAEEEVNQAKEEIELKITDVRQSLEDEVALFSKDLAEKILGRSI